MRRATRLAGGLVVAGLLVASGASARVVVRYSGFERGRHVGHFDQTNAVAGVLGTSVRRVYTGHRSGLAQYRGQGRNGYERGIFNVHWHDGDEVWYSAAFFLPKGFLVHMRGQVDLMRWDNWPTHPNDTDWGGLSIYGSDKHARLLRFRNGGPQEDQLSGPIQLPVGRWTLLTIHQKLSSGPALTELYVDGRRVASSTAPNTYGRAIRRVRFGIVAIAGGLQIPALRLWLDNTSITRRLPDVPKPPSHPYSPPAVTLTAPKNGATVIGPLHLAATASDPGGIARVDFAVDGKVVCSATVEPYECDDQAPPTGVGTHHLVTATAYDKTGLSSSSSVSVTSIL